MNRKKWVGGPAKAEAIFQTEAAECGLACLAMIANEHGHRVDLIALRERFGISLAGANLKQVMGAARHLDLQPRALRLELEELQHLEVPCILHWDFNHFVVLDRVAGKRVWLRDPATGRRCITIDEASRHFTGVALELSPAEPFHPLYAKTEIPWRQWLRNTPGLISVGSLVLFIAAVLQVLVVVSPLYFQRVIDQVIPSFDHGQLVTLSLVFFLVAIFQAVLSASRGWLLGLVGAKLNANWATRLFAHLLTLPMNFFEKRHTGDIVSRFFSVQSIQQTLTGNFVESLLNGSTSIFIALMLLHYSPGFTLLIVCAIGIYGVLRWSGFESIKNLKEELVVLNARQQSEMYESLKGIQALKLANKLLPRQMRMTQLLLDIAHKDATLQKRTAVFSASSQFIFSVQRIALVYFGALAIIEKSLSTGVLVTVVAYGDQLALQLGNLLDRLIEFRLLGMHVQRIADIANSQAEPFSQGSGPGVLDDFCVEGSGLYFRYSDQDPWLFEQCQFRIESGESVAIVGPSGCGKTTLIKIILGLIQPDSGLIKVGGVDIRQMGLEPYRDLLGSVMQDDELFSGSVAENISFFDFEADQSRIEEAAQLACIHDDIQALPMKYDTLVGDMGSLFSGGQKQRILLARALYRRPKILVLDEATSHLDVGREFEINQAIKSLKITRILIAHRPETIASADRILTVEHGRVLSGDAVANSYNY